MADYLYSEGRFLNAFIFYGEAIYQESEAFVAEYEQDRDFCPEIDMAKLYLQMAVCAEKVGEYITS